jgi:hypothetical protein
MRYEKNAGHMRVLSPKERHTEVLNVPNLSEQTEGKATQ